ncbi:PAS domain-containing sensor histidine kinase [Nitratireductor mangrovi]|uniref:histidine kinase n=1 Tax=Nitratireductor mangrovi TaxID=2599600 RepID=A0A5B8L3V0_9HYPH|nr:PAS domain-containing sensor histidine kinase [Nitratireductor mangrovi]QDZ02585.1 PAS domain-containing sensor histidine kinase [Nitratireductor mangrovi]
MEDLQDLYENAPCGYLSIGHDGRIVRANATLAAWLGYSTEEILARSFIDLLNVPGRIFYETHFAPLLRMQGFFEEVALDLVTKRDQRVAVLASAVEKRDDEGNLLFTRVTLLKAEERRRYERELVNAKAAAEAARNELAELNASLTARVEKEVDERLRIMRGLTDERETARLREQFLAILGHDLRNPLASIKSGLQMLSRDAQSERARSIIYLMSESSDRMAALIDDLLDLARIRLGGGFKVEPRSVEVAPILEQVVGELRTAHPDKAFETRLDLPQPVFCDAPRIGQLASNLLGNAVVHGAADEPIFLEAAIHDGWLSISVANKGSPIPEKVRKRLFRPFFRGEVRPSQQGLGLGLYISSEIAKAHGGTLRLTSGETETRFTLRMPVAPEARRFDRSKSQSARPDE